MTFINVKSSRVTLPGEGGGLFDASLLLACIESPEPKISGTLRVFHFIDEASEL